MRREEVTTWSTRTLIYRHYFLESSVNCSNALYESSAVAKVPSQKSPESCEFDFTVKQIAQVKDHMHIANRLVIVWIRADEK